MHLLKGYIVPHPPILIVGNDEEKSKLTLTLESFCRINESLKESNAELVILITPHGPLFVDGICVYDEEKIVGNLSSFGHKEITGIWDNDISFIDELLEKSEIASIPFVKLDSNLIQEFDLSNDLDHGAMVPLKLLEEGLKNKKIVVINYGLLPVNTLYKFGQLITETLKAQDKLGVVIASGDLSHYLSEKSPYGYRKEGVQFDNQYIKAFQQGDWEKLLFVDEEILEKAGECGKRSIEILLGAFDSVTYETKMLSYQSPFGIGYLTGSLTPYKRNEISKLADIESIQKEKLKSKIAKESDVVKLARKSIRYYLEGNGSYRVESALNIEESGQRLGVFVSLKDSGGLRGCMGSSGGIRSKVEEEIVDMAIKSATKDPRFDAVGLEELNSLSISVDILSPSQLVLDKNELNPKMYGIIVKSDYKNGLLLPDLEGIETIEDQISIALNKAGINPEKEVYKLYKFTVKRYY